MTYRFRSVIWSTEFKLLVCCTRPGLTDLEQQQIEDILENEHIDWEQLVILSFLHQVTPLLYHSLKSVRSSLIPKDILSAFEIYYQKHFANNQLLTRELLSILQALEQENITAIPFKGPLLAEQLYGDISLRTFRDLDFLIQKKDISKSLKIIEKKKYYIESKLSLKQKTAFWDYAGQDIFRHRIHPISIEPHWAFTPKTLAVTIDYAALFKRLEKTTLQSGSVYSFGPEDTLLILCIHGSKELWIRLKWICDIAQFLKTYPNIQWDVVLGRAADQGCLRMVYLGLLLAHEIMGSELPDNIQDYVYNKDNTIKRLAHQVVKRLTSGEVKDMDIYQLNTFRWAMRDNRYDGWCYLLQTMTTPRLRHFSLLNLPDRFFWIYYPIKLAHDYFAEPIWSIMKSLIKDK